MGLLLEFYINEQKLEEILTKIKKVSKKIKEDSIVITLKNCFTLLENTKNTEWMDCISLLLSLVAPNSREIPNILFMIDMFIEQSSFLSNLAISFYEEKILKEAGFRSEKDLIVILLIYSKSELSGWNYASKFKQKIVFLVEKMINFYLNKKNEQFLQQIFEKAIKTKGTEMNSEGTLELLNKILETYLEKTGSQNFFVIVRLICRVISKNVWKEYPSAREKILATSLENILKSPTKPQKLVYIYILSSISKDLHVFSEFSNIIQPWIGYVNLLPLDTAFQVLKIVLPLINVDKNFAESFITLSRKLFNSKEKNAKNCAIISYTSFLFSDFYNKEKYPEVLKSLFTITSLPLPHRITFYNTLKMLIPSIRIPKYFNFKDTLQQIQQESQNKNDSNISLNSSFSQIDEIDNIVPIFFRLLERIEKYIDPSEFSIEYSLLFEDTEKSEKSKKKTSDPFQMKESLCHLISSIFLISDYISKSENLLLEKDDEQNSTLHQKLNQIKKYVFVWIKQLLDMPSKMLQLIEMIDRHSKEEMENAFQIVFCYFPLYNVFVNYFCSLKYFVNEKGSKIAVDLLVVRFKLIKHINTLHRYNTNRSISKKKSQNKDENDVQLDLQIENNKQKKRQKKNPDREFLKVNEINLFFTWFLFIFFFSDFLILFYLFYFFIFIFFIIYFSYFYFFIIYFIYFSYFLFFI